MGMTRTLALGWILISALPMAAQAGAPTLAELFSKNGSLVREYQDTVREIQWAAGRAEKAIIFPVKRQINRVDFGRRSSPVGRAQLKMSRIERVQQLKARAARLEARLQKAGLNPNEVASLSKSSFKDGGYEVFKNAENYTSALRKDFISLVERGQAIRGVLKDIAARNYGISRISYRSGSLRSLAEQLKPETAKPVFRDIVRAAVGQKEEITRDLSKISKRLGLLAAAGVAVGVGEQIWNGSVDDNVRLSSSHFQAPDAETNAPAAGSGGSSTSGKVAAQ